MLPPNWPFTDGPRPVRPWARRQACARTSPRTSRGFLSETGASGSSFACSPPGRSMSVSIVGDDGSSFLDAEGNLLDAEGNLLDAEASFV